MSSVDAIECIAEQLRVATSFAQVFGELPSGDIVAKKRALHKQFAYLANLVYPDFAPKESEKQATETFRKLNELRHTANVAIEADTYDQAFSSRDISGDNRTSGKYVELRSSRGTYRLSDDPFHSGDFSVLYRGRFINGGVSPEVIVKIASDPQNNAWLEREVKILERFHETTGTDRLARIRVYIPEVLDTFLVPGKDRKRFRAIVLRQIPDIVSVEQIIKAYPHGLNPQDAAWVCRRIIAQTLAASMAGLVHGAIVPDHVLVNPFRHEPLHIGWAHAIEDPRKSGKRITHVIDRWRDYYPPEVFEKKPPDHRSDIYMAGKTMIKLLGGNVKDNNLPRSVPDTMAQAVLRCVEKNPARRWQNGKEALDGFTRTVRDLWGKVYRPLMMPVR